MKLYMLHQKTQTRDPDDLSEAVQGSRKWSLPNIKCPRCPLTAGPLRSYPIVDLSGLADRKPFESGWPVPLERFRELAEIVRPYIPAHLPIERSTHLGPLTGKVTRPPEDYATSFLFGTDLLREEAFVRLCERSGLRLQGVPAKVRCRKDPELRLVELQADALVNLVPEALPPQALPDGELRVCPLCGLNNIKEIQSDWIAIKRSSIPAQGDYFDLKEYPGFFMVTERLKEAMEEAGIRGVLFGEVLVTDE